MAVQYKIVTLPFNVDDISVYLNTLGLNGWTLMHIYNNQAYLQSGGSGGDVYVVSGSTQLGIFALTGSSNMFVGSQSIIGDLYVDGFITGTVSGNASTATTFAAPVLINGTSFDGSSNIIATSSYTTLDSIPVGIFSSSAQLPTAVVSSSAQIIVGLPVGTVSSSTQVTVDLPTGVMSGSTQTKTNLPTGVFSSSAQLPVGTMSGSTQTMENLPVGSVSSSGQIVYTSLDSIPDGIVSSSSQINTGSFTGSFIGEVIIGLSSSFVLPLFPPSASTEQTGSAYFDGLILYIWDGLVYKSASLS